MGFAVEGLGFGVWGHFYGFHCLDILVRGHVCLDVLVYNSGFML